MAPRLTYAQKFQFVLGLLCLVFFTLDADSLANDAMAVRKGFDPLAPRLILPPAAKNSKNVRWNNKDRVEIESSFIGNQPKPVAKIEGTFTRLEDWVLVYNGAPVSLEKVPNGNLLRFTLNVPVEKEATRLQLQAIGPLGQVEDESVVLLVPRWKRLVAVRKPKRHLWVASIGPSLLTYKESDDIGPVGEMSSYALTFKGSYQFLLKPPRWDLGINAFFTLLPLKTTVTTAPAETLTRYFGLNLRVGYGVPFIREPWRLSLLAGWYYTTMFVSNGAFGFQDMAGPQLFPVLRRVFRKGDSVFGYFKFSPVSAGGGLGFLTLANREIAFGAGWAHPIAGGKSYSLSLDTSNLALTLQDADRGAVVIESTSITLSLGMGF